MQRVALYYPTRLGIWQDVIRGIFRFARPTQPWLFTLATSYDPRVLLRWQPDAVIGQFSTPEMAKTFQRRKIPVIDTSYAFDQADLTRVRFNDFGVGEVAASYLMSRGFRHLGFVGRRSVAFEKERGRGFEACVQQAKIEPLRVPTMDRSRDAEENLGPVPERWRQWLQKAPKPLALFLAVDSLALRVSELCRDLQLRVPDDVALLGANDSLICQLAYPALSSVQLPTENLGYQAASLLADRLQKRKSNPSEIILEPSGVVTRQSTDVYATQDPLLLEALQVIRDEAVQGLTVSAVVKRLNVSRRRLERSFRAVLGRSPLQEIRRVRIERARQQLIESNDSMPTIATQCGFRDGRQFASTFRSEMGMTPTDYRKMFRQS